MKLCEIMRSRRKDAAVDDDDDDGDGAVSRHAPAQLNTEGVEVRSAAVFQGLPLASRKIPAAAPCAPVLPLSQSKNPYYG